MKGLQTGDSGAGAFSPRAVLALVLFGAIVFIALLWMIGSGAASGSTNDGGNHAGGKGLNGYAALATFLERQGVAVRRSRNEAVFDDAGLLVLTPPHLADPEEIDRIIQSRRYRGPTLLILPKWIAMRVPPAMRPPGARDGWVMLGGTVSPRWSGSLETLGDLDVGIEARKGAQACWQGFGRSGGFPDPGAVQSLGSGRVATLVQDGAGQTLAGYLDDGDYPVLAKAAGVAAGGKDRTSPHPVVIVAEPDLMNNYGFAKQNRAMLAHALVRAATGGKGLPVTFDLTLNGHARSANLLTLAFTPPFLAATLCLLIAALAVGWRAFLRFGPARKPVRAIAFGKRALVANSAGLIRRARRLHLVAGPYARRSRERMAVALGLPRLANAAQAEAAIDRAQAARMREAAPFSTIAARLAAARNPHDMLGAAQDIHALERTLQR